MCANRVVMTGPGPPSVLRYEQHEIATPGPHEVLIKQTAIGLYYIDIQHRTGRYALPRYHSPIGIEGAGIIEAVGAEVDAFKPGFFFNYTATTEIYTLSLHDALRPVRAR